MSTIAIVAQSLLILMFAFSASIKFLRTKTMIQHWKEYHYPFWFMYATAALETLGMLGIVAGFWNADLLKYASALLALLMLGAIHAHLFRARHNPLMAINALLMLVLSIFMIIM
ncbi:DoxX family protein [Paenibacillus sp. NEAU-GSW1]|uniref:DoxX family protein n=1 Tax=Paenibacillus sp. NEAU-GSW1 TaxID=2682486 RepID=UPI0012E132D1|nr:DoxX family protein [Paenibacillus sp. NEAU-GSW1]MUT68295.1 DoxX family protein [Paenibacillus sp. NEAU-GSW1]